MKEYSGVVKNMWWLSCGGYHDLGESLQCLDLAGSHGQNWSDSGNVSELLLIGLTDGGYTSEDKRKHTCDSP